MALTKGSSAPLAPASKRLGDLNEILNQHRRGEHVLSSAAHAELVKEMATQVGIMAERFTGSDVEAQRRSMASSASNLASTAHALLMCAQGDERAAAEAQADWDARAASWWRQPRGARPPSALVSGGSNELATLLVRLNS